MRKCQQTPLFWLPKRSILSTKPVSIPVTSLRVSKVGPEWRRWAHQPSALPTDAALSLAWSKCSINICQTEFPSPWINPWQKQGAGPRGCSSAHKLHESSLQRLCSSRPPPLASDLSCFFSMFMDIITACYWFPDSRLDVTILQNQANFIHWGFYGLWQTQPKKSFCLLLGLSHPFSEHCFSWSLLPWSPVGLPAIQSPCLFLAAPLWWSHELTCRILEKQRGLRGPKKSRQCIWGRGEGEGNQLFF